MIDIRQTDVFADWIGGLRDDRARMRVEIRIRRLQLGNAGDVKAVGGGVIEMRIDYGPGYRVYFTQQGNTVVVLLAGGDKRTQHRDIQMAQELARNL